METVREKINQGAYYHGVSAPATSGDTSVPVAVRRADLAEYKKKIRERSRYLEQVLFREDVLYELKISTHPKADVLWNLAWDRGHSEGYLRILEEAETLVELLR